MEAPPLVDPDQPLIDGYSIRLPFPMARRVEEDSLVFWHTPKGLTFWIMAHDRDASVDPVADWKLRRSDTAYDECVEREGSLTRYSYRLVEEGDDSRQPGFYGYVAEGTTEFFMAGYFNSPDMIGEVVATWRSLRSDR